MSAEPSDPAALLERAWSMEPGLRLAERNATLAELERVLDAPAPHGRNWSLELDAEKAIDLARMNQPEPAADLARSVLDLAAPQELLATARATEALGRALAWYGTDGASLDARRLLDEAARRYGQLDKPEWQAFCLFWRGHAVHFQNGELLAAEPLFQQALDLLAPDSLRRPGMLSYYADLLLALGRFDEVRTVLAEGAALAADPMSRAYVSWSRARLASVLDDALATERYIRETERDAGDWFDIHTGAMFLADAAEMLDRVGLRELAEIYLARATQRAPADEFVRQAHACLLARAGHPAAALEAFQELARGSWLEKRLLWRHTLFLAFATLRAGGKQAGSIAARALHQAIEIGGPAVAVRGEPGLCAALLSPAEEAGSAAARELLLGEHDLLIRLFGRPRFTRRDGTQVLLPPGKPSELVRMLAVHPQGMPVEQVLDWFFPDVPQPAARHRLRQIMVRLRHTAGALVVRTDDQLMLTPAWVDLQAFRVAADHVRAARRPKAIELAYSALAIWTGPPLPADPYASWASEHRRSLTHRYLTLLDLVATAAAANGSHEEALVALTTAIEEDPHDERRYQAAATQLIALGRHGAAAHLARSNGFDL